MKRCCTRRTCSAAKAMKWNKICTVHVVVRESYCRNRDVDAQNMRMGNPRNFQENAPCVSCTPAIRSGRANRDMQMHALFESKYRIANLRSGTGRMSKSFVNNAGQPTGAHHVAKVFPRTMGLAWSDADASILIACIRVCRPLRVARRCARGRSRSGFR